MPFGDPVVGGNVLIRPAIQSPNYVPGVSGWMIARDGTAEFNGIVIRGSGVFGTPGGQRIEISNTGVFRAYNSSNQLVVQLDAAGLLVQNPGTGASFQLSLGANTTIISLTPPNVVGHTFSPALFYAQSDSGTADAYARIESPQVDGGTAARISLFGANAGLSAPAEIKMSAKNVYLGGGFSVGTGPVARQFDTADSAAVTAETVVLTATSATYTAGRAYVAMWGPTFSTSNVNGRALFRVRKTNAAGQVLGFSGLPAPTAVAGNTGQGQGWTIFRNNTAADITAFICLTLQNLDGGANTAQQRIGAAGLKRYLMIFDIGDAASWDVGADLV